MVIITAQRLSGIRIKLLTMGNQSTEIVQAINIPIGIIMKAKRMISFSLSMMGIAYLFDAITVTLL